MKNEYMAGMNGVQKAHLVQTTLMFTTEVSCILDQLQECLEHHLRMERAAGMKLMAHLVMLQMVPLLFLLQRNGEMPDPKKWVADQLAENLALLENEALSDDQNIGVTTDVLRMLKGLTEKKGRG